MTVAAWPRSSNTKHYPTDKPQTAIAADAPGRRCSTDLRKILNAIRDMVCSGFE